MNSHGRMLGRVNNLGLKVVSAVAAFCGGLASGTAGLPEPPLVLYGLVTDVNGARRTTGEISFTLTPASGGAAISVTTTLSDIDKQFSFVAVVPCESAPGGLSLSGGHLQLRAEGSSRATVVAALNGVALRPRTSGDQSISTSIAARGALVRLNLSTIEYIDSDQDGLLDEWERRYFAGFQQGPNDDPDRDGASNLTEQLLGTNPLDGVSIPVFVQSVSLEGGNFKVTWSSNPGRKYRLLKSLDISIPRAAWTHVPSDLNYNGEPTLSKEVPRDPSGKATFFVVEELVP